MTDTTKLSTDKKTYSDEKIEKIIDNFVVRQEFTLKDIPIISGMLQVFMNEGDAVLEDLKALEAEVKYGLRNSFDIKHFEEKCDLTRSEKYCDTEKPD